MSKSIIVAKFGGTSMADAASITQSAKIAVQNQASLIVVSATAGTTDNLVNLADAVLAHDKAKAGKILTEVVNKHKKIASDLGVDSKVTVSLETIFKALSLAVDQSLVPGPGHKKVLDEILSFGELLSSNLMVAAMARQGVTAELIDAKEVIKIDGHVGHPIPLVNEIRKQAQKILAPKLEAGKVLITQGYIGSSLSGETATLGRGGSDYSAALLAEAVNAGQLEIWTDVSGIASSDPRIVKAARHLEQLSFQEAAELAIAGAKVLYPRTITPLRRANIPMYVGNTFAPETGGTLISSQTSYRPLVRAIALKANQHLVTLTTPEMANQFGYLAAIFDIFAKFKVSIDQVSTSEIAVAVVLESHILPNGALLKELKELGEVTIEQGLSVVSIIGNNVNNAPGLAQAIFADLGADKIPVRMICQGASRHNFCFLVADEHGRDMVSKLHKDLIETRL